MFASLVYVTTPSKRTTYNTFDKWLQGILTPTFPPPSLSPSKNDLGKELIMVIVITLFVYKVYNCCICSKHWKLCEAGCATYNMWASDSPDPKFLAILNFNNYWNLRANHYKLGYSFWKKIWTNPWKSYKFRIFITYLSSHVACWIFFKTVSDIFSLTLCVSLLSIALAFRENCVL